MVGARLVGKVCAKGRHTRIEVIEVQLHGIIARDDALFPFA